MKTLNLKRRYIIHETNFRDMAGNPLDVKISENVFEEDSNLGYQGKHWWVDNGHKLGENPKQEIEIDVEFDEVELKDGSICEGGLMDVIYTSYDVKCPSVSPNMPNYYNHAFDIAFTVVSPNNEENVTAEELLQGLERRLEQFRKNPSELIESCGFPFDTDEDDEKGYEEYLEDCK